MANCKSVITLCEDSFTVCGDVGLDISNMMSTPISGVNSLKEFKDIMVGELIDAKHFKTQSSYPTLRLVYERYMNSTTYCDTLSSQFDYCDMLQFSELVGTYWVDLIEQVVPATTIWGSTYVYGNTLWDQQKFKYKKYSLFSCELPNFGGDVVSPTTGWTSNVQVEVETLPNDEYYNEVSGSTSGDTFSDIKVNPTRSPKMVHIDEVSVSNNSCYGVGIVQTNCGSEFIGKIVETVINECAISVEILDYTISDNGTIQLWADVSGDIIGPISFLWSDGQTTQSATGLSYDTTHTVTVYDNGIEGCRDTASFTIPAQVKAACLYKLNESADWLITQSQLPIPGVTTLVLTSMIINGTEYVVGTPTITLDSANLNWVSANNGVTSGTTVGLTYTDTVDWLNGLFVTYGITEVAAQIALVNALTDIDGFQDAYFYLVRDAGTTFSIDLYSPDAGWTKRFTETGIFENSGTGTYYASGSYDPSSCGEYNIDNGFVVE